MFGALGKVTCVSEDGTEGGIGHEKGPVNTDFCRHPWKAAAACLDEAALPDGVGAELTSNEVLFSNSFLRLGFSRLRPMMTFMGWDSEGTGRSQRNLLNTHMLVGRAGDVEGFGVGKLLRVAVGRPQHQQQRLAGLDALPADLGVPLADPRVALKGAAEAKKFFDGRINKFGIGTKFFALRRMAEEIEHGCFRGTI